MTAEITSFARFYIACALWSSTDDDGEPLDDLYSQDDLAPCALGTMLADCADFQALAGELLARAGGSDEQNARDFWLTRNHHGAGFWDRGYGAIGQQLTELAHPYGECNLYVGDDSLIYVS